MHRGRGVKEELDKNDLGRYWGTPEEPLRPIDAEHLRPLLPDKGSHLLDRLTRWQMVYQDLRQARDAFATMQGSLDTEDVTRVEALWWFATLKYARCFASGKARRMSLGWNEVSKSVPDQLHDIHTLLVTWRNEHIAHASSAETERAHLTLVFDDDCRAYEARILKTQPAGYGGRVIDLALALVEAVGEYVMQKGERDNEAFGKVLKDIPVKTLRDLPVMTREELEAIVRPWNAK